VALRQMYKNKIDYQLALSFLTKKITAEICFMVFTKHEEKLTKE
jgi:hypothetical protein